MHIPHPEFMVDQGAPGHEFTTEQWYWNLNDGEMFFTLEVDPVSMKVLVLGDGVKEVDRHMIGTQTVWDDEAVCEAVVPVLHRRYKA